MIEDVKYDAELIEYELWRENLNFSSIRVETEVEFIKELENCKPDVILLIIHFLVLMELQLWK